MLLGGVGCESSSRSFDARRVRFRIELTFRSFFLFPQTRWDPGSRSVSGVSNGLNFCSNTEAKLIVLPFLQSPSLEYENNENGNCTLSLLLLETLPPSPLLDPTPPSPLVSQLVEDVNPVYLPSEKSRTNPSLRRLRRIDASVLTLSTSPPMSAFQQPKSSPHLLPPSPTLNPSHPLLLNDPSSPLTPAPPNRVFVDRPSLDSQAPLVGRSGN